MELKIYYTHKITAEKFDSFLGVWVDWFVRTTECDAEKYLQFIKGEKGFRNISIANC